LKEFGIVCKKITGQSSSVNEDKVAALRDTVLQHLMAKYTLKDIFNASESDLFYNMLPDKHYVFSGESSGDMRLDKERISILVCASVDCFEICKSLL
jgi:hypothetical protein